MNIKKLEWTKFNSQFASSEIAYTGLNSQYFVYLDLYKSKFKAIDIYKKEKEFNSIEEAKDYCQKDFEEKINNLLK